MTAVQQVIEAIAALQTKLSSISVNSGSSFTVTPALGTLGISGANPIVTLAEAVDPKDFFRCSAIVSVDMVIHHIQSWSGEQSGLFPVSRTVRKVYTVDGVGGVGIDQKTVVLPPIPLLTAFSGTTIGAGGGTGVVWSEFPGTTLVVASSSLQLLTRYHHVA